MSAAGEIDPAEVVIVAGRPGANGGDVGQYASFTQDASGGQHIAYYDATFRRIKYAHRPDPGAGWTVQSLSTATMTGEHATIAVGTRQQVNTTASVINGVTLVTVTSGVLLSPVLVGGRFQAGFSGFHEIVDVDAKNSRITLATPFAGATNPAAAAVFEFYQPVIAYQRGNTQRRLEVARPRGDGGWTFDTVDGPGFGFNSTFTGFDNSIAIDTGGKLHLAYRDAMPSAGVANRLRYGTFLDEEEGWVLESADPERERGFGARLVLDANDLPLIFHRDNLGRSLHYTRKSGSWSDATLSTGGNNGFGIGAGYYAAGHQLLVSYQQQVTTAGGQNVIHVGTVRDSTTTGSATTHVVFSGQNVGDYTGIAQGNTTGSAVVAYYDGNAGALKALPIGSADSPTSGVLPMTLDDGVDVGRFVSPGVGLFDQNLYAAYYDAHAQALKLAEWDGVSSPSASFVDGTKFGTDSTIALTSTTIAVAYFDSASHNLHLARWPIGESPASPFFSDVVVDASSSIVGESVSMVALGETLHMVYFDRANEALNGAVVYADGTIRRDRIYGGQSGVRVGPHCSIAAGEGTTTTTARLAIAFYVLQDLPRNETLPTLYVGFVDGPPTIDPGSYDLDFDPRAALTGRSNIGRFCSIAVDSGNSLIVSLLDDAKLGPALMIVDGLGTGFIQEIESSLFTVGGFGTSVALNPTTGVKSVAYYDVTNGGLKFAAQTPNGWAVELVDDIGDTGHTPVLRFDPVSNLTRILYYDKTRGALRLASRSAASNTATWQKLTLLEETMGVHPAMVIAGDSTLVMSFHQLSTGNLLSVGATVPPIPTSAGWNWLMLD